MSRDQAQNPNFLFEKLHRQYKSDFPNLIERSVYNKRRRLLAPLMNKVRQRLVHKLVPSEDTFVLDSMPMEVCKFARANRVKVCKSRKKRLLPLDIVPIRIRLIIWVQTAWCLFLRWCRYGFRFVEGKCSHYPGSVSCLSFVRG